MRMDALVGPTSAVRRPPPSRAMLLRRAVLLCVLLGVLLAGSAGSAHVIQDRQQADLAGAQPDLQPLPASLEQSLLPPEGRSQATPASDAGARNDSGAAPMRLPDLTARENLAPAIQLLVLLTVLSLAPAILVLCTSFTRIIIVLSLLRQALGTQNLPPNQVLTGLALFMTFVVMAPTWGRINESAIQPYLDGAITQQQALDEGVKPLRDFMIAQIRAAGNDETVLMFQEYARQPAPATWGDVGTTTLIPAFVLSELKVAFLMGFKVYLPFLVIDMVISAVLISMGMMMLPPVLISLPFKLLLFVLVDGWTLLVGSLMGSFMLTGG